MNHSEFFLKFYPRRNDAGLNGCSAKHKVVEFFFKNSMDADTYHSVNRDENTYLAWFNGDSKRNPTDMWDYVNESEKKSDLSVALLNALNEPKLLRTMSSFGIILQKGETSNKASFANAVAEQFFNIARGHGEATNICPVIYRKKTPPATYGDFGAYLQGASNHYRNIKILGEGEYPLYDYFVCNRIGRTATPFFHRSSSLAIENADLNKLLSFDSRTETRHIILIGSGGMGKTLMLQHLFLEAANQYDESGLLPILIELRNFFYYQNDILSCLVGTVKNFEQTFNESAAKKLLLQGRCQILLDGLDEMDLSDINLFQHKLSEFISRYPNNQIVIASRDCDAIKGINRFVRLYIQPFDNTQSMELIDKLLIDNNDADNVKHSILDWMESGFIKKDGVFASNPMLLTFIVCHHNKINTLTHDKGKFYEMVYNAIVVGHDKEKEAYDRTFKSVDDVDEFTNMFREFCGKSFQRGIFEFSSHSFEKIFRLLTSRNELNNPGKCKMKAFQHDACATACMMYEQETDIYYIDPGFQEYLFAEHYYHADKESTVAMGRSLWGKPLDMFHKFDAFDMLFQMAKDKVEVCLYLPYLETIFQNASDDTAFEKYICNGYGNIKYSFTDKNILQKQLRKFKIADYTINLSENEPCNIIHYLILRTLKKPTSIKIETQNKLVCYPDREVSFFVGMKYENNPTLSEFRLEKFPQSLYPQKDDTTQISYPQTPVVDCKGLIIPFGNEYDVKLNRRFDKEEIARIMDMIRSDSQDTYDSFLSVKEYYEEISQLQETNQFI